MPRNSTAATIGLQSPLDRSVGTLLWIGDRSALPFRDAYDFCETSVSQLAYRRTLHDALVRPASDVHGILLCQPNDASDRGVQWEQICEQYPHAVRLLLLGPLVAGSRPSPTETFATEGIWWHGWQNRLPQRLRECGVIDSLSPKPRSLAIVSQDRMMAEALLAIASVGAMPAVICRPDALNSIQGIDEYWWDDSATCGKPLNGVVSSVPARTKHLLISHFVTPRLCEQAKTAGFERVIAKPGDYHALLRRVSQSGARVERHAA
ncbi:hypothetical protein [Roseiconus lacunae]|uniref:Uncharacterized protein n=1 Tax=Roseiconus lacunae TaxID=2605694 RepID=A0ABT7PI35_9BACT|nr:hypothetical protein [Roseiconus lacunae]MDM4016169.1 hypothetical protein [Roseiconus lacunae]